MTATPPAGRLVPDPAHAALVAALRDALDSCDRSGWNLPELLSSALEELGRERGGTAALVAHRPGSWEATHVVGLAAGADWPSSPSW